MNTFSDKAMATLFQIMINHEDADYAGKAAHEAFSLLHKSEQKLSYFIENSDVSRINRAPENQFVRVSEETHRCLLLCLEYHVKTGGYFNPALGQEKYGNKEFKTSDLRNLVIDPGIPGAIIKRGPVRIDLGGIGKGYALDRMAEVLEEWGIDHFLLHGGYSSVLSRGSDSETEGWKVTVSNPVNGEIVETLILRDQSVSNSGTRKGGHVIDPINLEPVKTRKAVWVVGKEAVLTDAFSTACLAMPEHRIAAMKRQIPDIEIIRSGD